MPIEDKHEYIYDPCDTLKQFFPNITKLTLDEQKMKEFYRALKAEVCSFEKIIGTASLTEQPSSLYYNNKAQKINDILAFAKEHEVFDSSMVSNALSLTRKYAAVLLDFMFQKKLLSRSETSLGGNNGKAWRYSMMPEQFIINDKKDEKNPKPTIGEDP